jgi:PadR family transcriptional regulator PadR
MELLQGTLDVLILKGLAWGPKHGYAVARWIEERSRGSLTVLDGALYVALHRMEDRGWIAAEWGKSSTGRPAKMYRLTPVGRRQFASEASEWAAYATAVGRVLGTKTRPA